MKLGLRNYGWLLPTLLAGGLLAGCGGVPGPMSGGPEWVPNALVLGPSGWPKAIGGMMVRTVDSAGVPVAGVAVMVYEGEGPGRGAGVTNDKGELLLPVQPDSIYEFIKNRRTLLGQTSQNLFSLGPSAPHFYRYDNKVLVVPLSFAPAGSPLVSPVIDPLKTAPAAVPVMRVGQ